MIPAALQSELTRFFGTSPQGFEPVGGGDINQAARFNIGSERYFLKWHPHPPTPPEGWPDMFTAEARGLELLAQAGALRVPEVVTYGTYEGGGAYLVMEWVERATHWDEEAVGTALGYGLAQLHRHSTDAYGLDHNNYCGLTPQPNPWTSSWIEFYALHRLEYQMDLAGRKGRMPRERRRRLEKLMERLDRWIDEKSVRPALIHGDLWGGNWLVSSKQEPVLIDPAVYYADREAELAMCHLFGGFPSAFFRAYDEAWPPLPGRDERIPLYQLYHVLNHLNLFGEMYGGHVDSILRRYVG